MIKSQIKLIKISALFVAAAIVLSAFGAHMLKDRLSPYLLEVFNKASFYHLTQSLGALLMTLAASIGVNQNQKALRAANYLLIGTLIFSLSLYLLAYSEQRWLGAITPIGGVTIIFAWISFALSFKE